MSIAVEDWDDLSAARRRRSEQAAAEPLVATGGPGGDPGRPPVPEDVEDDDSLDEAHENLRPVLSIAGANIGIWALAHASGVVELIGVSFMASVGLLLAAYVLREWHRDRAALVCLAGALPLPVTIVSLLS